MTLAFVGLGANLGDPRAAVEDAFRALAGLGPLRASPLYRTEPLGDRGDPWYVNAVAEIRTDLEPAELLAQLLEFERRAGRSRSSETARWAPRRLDLDLLLYGDWQIDSAALRVPHPGLAQRRFVLEPLAELAPDLAVPGTGFSVRQLLAALDDPLQVEKLPPDHGSQTTIGPEVPPT
jgi:2-amino-4-hydroxy-6-hydroxymethyldihydropteridine diphosphokinase